MSETNTPTNNKKSPGPIRWNAIIPFSILMGLFALYMTLFFDAHLRKAMEWGGYKALGAEVNIGDIKSSFFNASIEISKLELTDKDKPTHNFLEVGSIRFSMLWDALLRAKVAINEIAVEKISYNTQRKTVGRVAPPEPPKPGPSFTEELKEDILNEADSRYQDNVFGNIIGLLKGDSSQSQLKEIEDKILTKKLIANLEIKLKEREKYWNEKFKSLPQSKDVQNLTDRLNKVKVKDFKSPQELEQSIREIDAILKEGDQKYKLVDSAWKELEQDLKSIQADYQTIEKQFKADVDLLKNHFKIPKIDAASIGRSVFLSYLKPYISKFNTYKKLAIQYLPPKFSKKISGEKSNGSETADSTSQEIVPHERTAGVSYEFGRPNAYPLFWIKLISISSQAGSEPNQGEITGKITDIASNQNTTQKPTELKIAGAFPANQINGVTVYGLFDNRKELSLAKLDFNVKSYPIAEKQLLSGDVDLGFKSAQGQIALTSELIGLKQLTLQLENRFNSVQYLVDSKNELLKSVLSNILQSVGPIFLNAKLSGDLPKVNFDLATNLGTELENGFQKELNVRIEQAKKRVQEVIDQEIGKQKAALESEIKKFKDRYDAELKKVQEQINTQKKQAEQKINDSKKSLENDARKKLEQEGKKTVDDLKKKFGF